jgi:uncharacterized membrane protein (Fun14 family)
MNPLGPRILGALFGAAAAGGDGPWRSRTVLLAFLAVLAGLSLWVRDVAKGPPPPPPAQVITPAGQATAGGGWDFSRPVPGYVRVCASYIGGFFIGWAFRRFLRLALSLVALAALLVGLGKCVGWNTAPAETKLKDRATWIQREANAATDYLKGLLPSTTAGAVGVFLGFRRKSKLLLPEAPQSDAG